MLCQSFCFSSRVVINWNPTFHPNNPDDDPLFVFPKLYELNIEFCLKTQEKNHSVGSVRCEANESDLTSRKKEARNEKFHDLSGQLLIYTLQNDNFR